MKKTIIWGSLIPLVSLVLTCAPMSETQKSEKYRDIIQTSGVKEEVEKILSPLFKINPNLAEELQRLPELRKGLDEKVVLALNRVVIFYTQSSNQDEVKQIFNRILSIGKKERRKFSASLQAFFWLAQEG